jgi:hypothetical protein
MLDHGIQNLLDLHGNVLDQEDGYWIKLEAWRVAPTKDIPHGIRYSLTLHAPSGKRILGYDNAHAVKVKGKSFRGRSCPLITNTVAWQIMAYRMVSAAQISCWWIFSVMQTMFCER